MSVAMPLETADPGTHVTGALTVRAATDAEWAASVGSFWGYGYRQTWAYGETLARLRGAASEHVLVYDAGRLVGAADVRLRRLPVVGGGLAYVSGGPLLNLRSGDERLPFFLARTLRALKQEYAVRRGCVLRCVPPLDMADEPAGVAELFRAEGFGTCASPPPYRTIQLDISQPVERIRGQFAQKWRNALNGALKQPLSVSVREDAEAIARFATLFTSFVARKGFAVDLGPDFYSEVQGRLPPKERLVVQLAELDGDLVAGHISSMLGDTCVYLLGATGPAGLRSKAAYLLQWNTILLAKERGLRWYDLGGIDPVDNPGVYHFKRGLGGKDVTAPGPFELSPGGWRALTMRRAEAVYQYLAGRKDERPAESQAAKAGDTGAPAGEENGVR
jgi:hypothetical protein